VIVQVSLFASSISSFALCSGLSMEMPFRLVMRSPFWRPASSNLLSGLIALTSTPTI